MANPFTGQRIEFHILQAFPVTCLNRDDVGAPKSAWIGGKQRGRVSSQCWKRQVRMALRNMGVQIAVRTKRISELIAEACKAAGASETQAEACGEAAASALTDNTLLFFSHAEAKAVADYAKSHGFDANSLVAGTKSSKKADNDDEGSKTPKKATLAPELKKILKNRLITAENGLDIALFGRMVAQDPEMNMEAASCFAHAITTHESANELDFFTALDDLQIEPGSAHMGTLEFNSGVYYRYVSLDLGQLYENLGGDDLDKAVEMFTKALYVAVPEARQTTQTGLRPWDYARVQIRKGQGMQASFEDAVRPGDGYLKPSIKALDEQLARSAGLAGSLFGLLADYTFGVDAGYSIDKLAQDLGRHVAVNGEKA